jgi:type VI protein secretion system component VasK
MSIGLQLISLFVLAVPIAAVAWTITHEEVFHELRQRIRKARQESGSRVVRKFLYLFLCDFCLSHWVALFFLILADFQLLIDGWRGYLIGFFALTWIANQYIAIYARLRLDLRREQVEIEATERQVEAAEANHTQR